MIVSNVIEPLKNLSTNGIIESKYVGYAINNYVYQNGYRHLINFKNISAL